MAPPSFSVVVPTSSPVSRRRATDQESSLLRLPQYRAVEHTLTSSAISSIDRLTKESAFIKMRDVHKEALQLLIECGTDLQETVFEKSNIKRKELERKKKQAQKKKKVNIKREKNRSEDAESDENSEEEEQEDVVMEDDDEEAEEEANFSFSAQIAKVETGMDLQMRKLIDSIEEAHSSERIIKNIVQQANNQKENPSLSGPERLRNQLSQRVATFTVAGGPSFSNNPTQATHASSVTAPGETQPPPSLSLSELLQPSKAYIESIQEARDKYLSKTLRARYSEYPNYVEYKTAMWDARYGPEGPPMPRKDTWFPEHRGTSPAPGVAARGRTSTSQPGHYEDDEDDLETTRVRISTKCPLSLQELTNPVSSRMCPHVFDKTSIEQFIRDARTASSNNRRQGQPIGNPNCPVGGCQQQIGLSDLFVDVVMVRKIKKLQEMKRREEEEESESGEELDGDAEFEDL